MSSNKDMHFRRWVTIVGVLIVLALIVAVKIYFPGHERAAAMMSGGVLGSTIALIRIFELLTVHRAKGSAIPVASLGFLWIFKLVCLGIFVITLKSNPQTHIAIVLASISLIFVPVFVGIGFRFTSR